MREYHFFDDEGNEFFMNEKGYHRDDGPAMIFVVRGSGKGNRAWLINGQFHRLDGPAIESSTGNHVWYFDGYKVDCNTQEQFLKIIKMKAFW